MIAAIVGLIAFCVLALVAATLLALGLLAIVLRRWRPALGVVGLVALFGFWVAPSRPVEVFSQHRTGAGPAVSAVENAAAPDARSSASAEFSPPMTEQLSDAERTATRPDWLERSPGMRDGVYEVVVKSGLYTTEGECQRALEAAERAAAAEWLDASIEPGAGQLVPLDPRYIRDRLRRDEFQETTRASVGPMRQSYARLAFGAAVREELLARWRQAIASERLWRVGGAAAATLVAIGSAFAYLVGSNRRAAARDGRLSGARPFA